MSRSRPRVEVEDDLNLSPIMNLVMILIPLLLLSVEFSKASVIELESPRRESPGDDNRDTEVLVPSVVVGVSFDGFRISTLGASVEGFSELVPRTRTVGGMEAGRRSASVKMPIQRHRSSKDWTTESCTIVW